VKHLQSANTQFGDGDHRYLYHCPISWGNGDSTRGHDGQAREGDDLRAQSGVRCSSIDKELEILPCTLTGTNSTEPCVKRPLIRLAEGKRNLYIIRNRIPSEEEKQPGCWMLR
jgi:hypothetical protein